MKEIVSGPDLLPKGNIKVELFEAGKKVLEHNDHNFISKGVREYLFKTVVRNLFTRNRPKDGVDFNNYIADVFRTLVLTDFENPEEPEKEWAVQGNVIGRAVATTDFTLTGPNIGSYNVTESSTSQKRVKMVFDFPTNAANGTIKSVYFAADTTNTGANGYGHLFNIREAMYPATKIPYDTTNADVRKVYKEGDKIYILVSKNSKLLVEVFDLGLVHQNTITLTYNETIYDAAVVDGHIYTVSSTSIKKTALSNPGTSTTVMVNAANHYMGAIAYNAEFGMFVVSASHNSTSIVTSYMIDPTTFSVLQEALIPISIGYQEMRTTYIGDVTIFGRRHQNTMETLYDRQFVGSSTNILGSIDDNIVVQYAGANYPMWMLPPVQIGSRSLLETPITKTNTQTMKITYEFILE